MVSFNQFIVLGNLTRDPEKKDVSGDTTVAELSVAVDRPGEESPCDFFRVTAFGKTADACAAHLKKGAGVMIVGRLKYDRWETEGQKRSRISLAADRVVFLPNGRKADAPKPEVNETAEGAAEA